MFSEPHSHLDSGAIPLNQTPSSFGALRVDTRRLRQWASTVEIEMSLGRAVWAERGCPVGYVLHWMGGNQLLAVVDTGHGHVAYRTKLRREELGHAHVVARPSGAAFTPEGFVHKSVHDILWQYGYYAPDAIEQLPARIYTDALVVRPKSRVTQGLLTLRHAAILDALANEPQTITELSELLSMPVAQLAKALAPLYLARCISTRHSSPIKRSINVIRHFIGGKRK
jgi:hypothetical protein